MSLRLALIRYCGPLASSVLTSCTLLVATDDLSGRDAGAGVSGDAGVAADADASTSSDAGAALGPLRSCQDLLTRVPLPPSGVYVLDPDGADPGEPFSAYCETRASEDGGGWTLVLKIDGTKTTFAKGAPIWTSLAPFNGTDVDLNRVEAKLAGFSAASVQQVRLGMNTGGTTRWVVISVVAPSLVSVFAGGPNRATVVGRSRWIALMPSATLQDNCNREGFNAAGDGQHTLDLRLGLIMNGEPDCASPDTNIGVGQDVSTGISCGAYAGAFSTGGAGGTPAFCYLMVR